MHAIYSAIRVFNKGNKFVLSQKNENKMRFYVN